MLRHSLCLGYCLSINITWLAGKYCLSNKPQDEKESTVLFNCKWSFTRKFLITFAFSLELRNWSVGDRESYDVASSWASLDPACHRAGIPTPKMSLGPHLKGALDFVHSLHWQGFLWVCFRLWCPFFLPWKEEFIDLCSQWTHFLVYLFILCVTWRNQIILLLPKR